MEKKNIVSRLIKVAEVIKADSDYVYDPEHKNRPHGGGQWYRTERGWTTNKSLENRDTLEKGSASSLPRDVQLKNSLNKKTSPEHLRELSKIEDHEIRYNVASNPNTPSDTLDEMVEIYKDKNYFIRDEMYHAVSGNGATTSETLEKMVTKSSVDPKTLHNIIEHPKVTPEILDYISTHTDSENTLSSIAWQKKTSPKTLKNLSQSEYSSVREAVAGHPNTDESTLKILSQDDDSYVKEYASKNLARKTNK